MRQERNRYEVFGVIASGGMATVEYARLHGPHGFTRSVAIKRMHKHFASDPSFVEMFLDEARLSARLDHANIVSTLDVIDQLGELGLVMEYVHGESLARLLQLANQQSTRVPVRVATALATSVLHGLHTAHEACSDSGVGLGIVHRDVSPHNIIVGADGVPRILDFGIAKAATKLHITPSGEIKGKLAYIAPEQLSGGAVDRRTDVYGASVVVWEALTGFPLFGADNEMGVISRVLHDCVSAPSEHAHDVPIELDRIVLRGLSRDPSQRFATALDMADALERSVGIASQSEVAKWLQGLAGSELAERLAKLRAMQDSQAWAQTAVQALAPQASLAGTRRIEVERVEPVVIAQAPSDTSAVSRPQRSLATSALAAAALVAGSIVIARGLWAHEGEAQGTQPIAADATRREAALEAAEPAMASTPVAEGQHPGAPAPAERSSEITPPAPQLADATSQEPPSNRSAQARRPSGNVANGTQPKDRAAQSQRSSAASARAPRSVAATPRAQPTLDHPAQAESAADSARALSSVEATLQGPRPVEPAKPSAACSPFIYDGPIKRPNEKCVAESRSR